MHVGWFFYSIKYDAEIQQFTENVPANRNNLSLSVSAQKNTRYLLIFDAAVILVCMTSSVLCIRSIFLAIRLLQVNFRLCRISRIFITDLGLVWLVYFLRHFMTRYFIYLFFYRDFPSFVFRSTTVKYVRPTDENF